ncbi:MAG TPA: hypothetical protein VIC03_10815 [Gemmatimonadaceae bacterium]|jgi:hypothetical protein
MATRKLLSALAAFTVPFASAELRLQPGDEITMSVNIDITSNRRHADAM